MCISRTEAKCSFLLVSPLVSPPSTFFLFFAFVSALTELGDMEGHAYIGPFNPALCHAASLLAQHWEVGLASPGCLDSNWQNLPPITPPSRVLFTVLRFFGWAHVAVVSGEAVV